CNTRQSNGSIYFTSILAYPFSDQYPGFCKILLFLLTSLSGIGYNTSELLHADPLSGASTKSARPVLLRSSHLCPHSENNSKRRCFSNSANACASVKSALGINIPALFL